MTVYISTGPATVQVPKLVGRTEADARATLSGAGLIVREPPGSRCSDAVDVGQVAKQNPEPGTPVRKGRAIGFDLANSPCTVDRADGRRHADRRGDRAPAAGDDQPERDQADAPDRDRSDDDGSVLDQDIEGSNVKPFVVTLTVGQLDQTATTPTTPTP